jgi:dethiobiotin synthetase
VRSLFVTGTGTSVGKTVTTAAICVATGARAMKPVQTGSGEPVDLEFIWKATGHREDPELACPYRFVEPLAPAVAARRAGRRIDVERIRAGYETLGKEGPLVVEGAGGLLVELTEGFSMADLAASLGLPIVIACAPGLGTLNHTALTAEAARTRGLEVAGLVISAFPARPDSAARTNPAQLARIAPLLGVIPHVPRLDVEAAEPSALAELAPHVLDPSLGGTFDAQAFLDDLEGSE